jgi:hypothetical protein
LPYGAISAISLATKAILIAKIWKERTGEGLIPISAALLLINSGELAPHPFREKIS